MDKAHLNIIETAHGEIHIRPLGDVISISDIVKDIRSSLGSLESIDDITFTPVDGGPDCSLPGDTWTSNVGMSIQQILQDGVDGKILNRATIPDRRWLVQIPLDRCPNARMLMTTDDLARLIMIQRGFSRIQDQENRREIEAAKAGLRFQEHNRREAESALLAPRP